MEAETLTDRPSSIREAAWVMAWAVAWLTPFGVFVFWLVPAGFGMYGRSWVGGMWFAVATALALLLYRKDTQAPDALRDVGIWPWVALGVSAALTVSGYAWAHLYWPLDPEALAPFRDVQLGLVRMDGVYLAVKLPELVFQQALILVLVRHLQLRGLKGWRLIGAFMIIFTGIHLPLLVIKGLAGLPFILACVSASLVFVPLIAHFRRGVVLSFCVHHVAYVIAGLALRAGLQG